jgi:hypothetical protein
MFDQLNNNQDKNPIAPATQHFPNFSWNAYAKEIAWKSATTTIYSEEGLKPRNPVHTVTIHPDVKKITKAGVINMLDALYTNEDPQLILNSVPYRGPNQINLWIFENCIKLKFQADKITEYFDPLQSSMNTAVRRSRCVNH